MKFFLPSAIFLILSLQAHAAESDPPPTQEGDIVERTLRQQEAEKIHKDLRFLVTDVKGAPIPNVSVKFIGDTFTRDEKNEPAVSENASTAKSNDKGIVTFPSRSFNQLTVTTVTPENDGKFIPIENNSNFNLTSSPNSARTLNDLSDVPAGFDFVFKVRKLVPVKALATFKSSISVQADGSATGWDILGKKQYALKGDERSPFYDFAVTVARDKDYIPGKTSEKGTYISPGWTLQLSAKTRCILLADRDADEAPEENYVDKIDIARSGKPRETKIKQRIWWKIPGKKTRYCLIEMEASYNGWKDQAGILIRGWVPTEGERIVQFSSGPTTNPLPWELEPNESVEFFSKMIGERATER